jgi:glutaredoxin
MDVEYVDVLSDSEKLNTMLKYSNGTRKVPVIVDQGEVAIGFQGKA